MFLTKAEQKGSLQTWTSADLTEILQIGTVFYESIDMKFKDKNGFVDIEALKGNVQMCNEVFVVRIPEVPQGVLNSAARLAGGMLTLEQTLGNLISKPGGWIIVTNSYSIGLRIENENAYIFNSNSCGKHGDSSDVGNAFMIQVELVDLPKIGSSYIELNYGSTVALNHKDLHHHMFCCYKVEVRRSKFLLKIFSCARSSSGPKILALKW